MKACTKAPLFFNFIMMSSIIFFKNVAGHAVFIKQKQTGSFQFPAMLRAIITNALYTDVFLLPKSSKPIILSRDIS